MIHVAITRRIRPGQEQAFEARMRRFFSEAEALSGTSGASVIYPADGDHQGSYGILRTFTDEPSRAAFYASDLYRQFHEDVKPMMAAEPDLRDLVGLEAFFRQGLSAPPPKWKMALLTWLGVVVAAFTVQTLVVPVVSPLPHALMLPLTSAFVVSMLTWGIMPLLVKAARGWLRPTRR